MNINKSEMLSNSLKILTYNGKAIKIPKDGKLNIYMGIGLWSAKDRLSCALPVDVMQMLLTAAVLRSQIIEANPDKPSRVILLIADSMALRESGDKQKVAEIAALYKKCLDPLLLLLKLNEDVEIILSSDLEETEDYQTTLQSVQGSKILQELQENKKHYHYICTQTAITQFMHEKRDVGVKVGWILKTSHNELNDYKSWNELKSWDELKFDRLHQVVCRNAAIQCLYAKAGLKQPQSGVQRHIEEGCPYTAYEKDCRYVIQILDQREISAICPLQKRVATQWKNVAEICLQLSSAKIVSENILPKLCLQTNNQIKTVYRMLNHWSNIGIIKIKG